MDFPAQFFWYGRNSAGLGHPPEWVDKLLAASDMFYNSFTNRNIINKAKEAATAFMNVVCALIN